MDTEIYYYTYETPHGPITLLPDTGGRYKVMFQDDNLGSFHSAAAAADDCGLGQVPNRNDIDFESIGVPHDLAEWDKKPLQQ